MSNNRWVASVAMLCPAEHRETACQTAAAMSGNPNDATPMFFSRPVGGLESDIVLYYMAHSRIRGAVLMVLPQLETQYPGATWFVTQHDDPEYEVVSVQDFFAQNNLRFLDEEEEL